MPDNANGEVAPLSEDRPLSIIQRVRWMRILQIFLDGLIAGLSFFGAYAIRFDGHLSAVFLTQFWIILPVIVLARLAANWGFGVYRRLWRYTGLTEMTELGCAVLTVSTAIVVARALEIISVEGNNLSYSIIFIDMCLSFLLLSCPRVLRRLMTEHNQRRHWRQPARRRGLLVGAGDAGQMVLKEMLQRRDLGVDVIGLVDDDPQKVKKRIAHLTVFGTTKDLPRLVEDLFIDQVIIAMPSAPPAEIRRIVDMCRQAEVETRILPGLFELINGKVSVSQLREVSLEDLLGRDPVELDSQSISSYVEDRCVLVTGAGGSIGSELCRQLMRFQPRKLLILGKGENSIFDIQQELRNRSEPVTVVPIIADIRDHARLASVFEKHRPRVVFHAAAHKHVPLMEENVVEAISNNIRGTQNVAELSAQYGVETFVLVSSDKAVNPTSIMGATKRIAELVIQNLAARSRATKYVAVRFGNVLASRGSVIPLWKRQIEAGGPITVTHPEATRYFMLIPEAVQLILQAGALGQGGEIFVLDMGKPVKIVDLANDLIRFSGLRPGHDIQLEFIGLRPGEKLYEELLTEEEGLTKTVYEKIFVGQPQPLGAEELAASIQKLYQFAYKDDETAIRQELTALVGGTLSSSGPSIAAIPVVSAD